MDCRSWNRNKWFAVVAFWLATLGLVLYPAPSLYAQDLGTGADSSTSEPEAVDHASIDWENLGSPFVPKEEAVVDVDEPKKAEQYSYSLYLPGMRNDGGVNAAGVNATTAVWTTIFTEGFEGIFPPTTGNWSILDYNGSTVGTKVAPSATLVWDDTPTKFYQGYYSAHPNDWSSYANFTDTWMRYGPLNLVGARDARMLFVYWLDTEQYYDFFSWEYTCKNKGNWKSGGVWSGPVKQWVAVTQPLIECIGSNTVYIKFLFRSDYSNPSNPAPGGVWVDSIQVQKYQ
jgi:hypothetical protein